MFKKKWPSNSCGFTWDFQLKKIDPVISMSMCVCVCVLHHPHKTWLYTTRNSASPHPTGQNCTTSQTPHHPLARHLFGSQGILEVWWYTTLFHTEEAIQ